MNKYLSNKMNCKWLGIRKNGKTAKIICNLVGDVARCVVDKVDELFIKEQDCPEYKERKK